MRKEDYITLSQAIREQIALAKAHHLPDVELHFSVFALLLATRLHVKKDEFLAACGVNVTPS